ncbi:hypothetical protein GCM10027187_40060 [Streptosporangium sandarakinum]|uniref:Uncharacterized protein n=1 Tax=Streptosporangium sandarakinum TaxID=1260955 RepID=A0A852V4K5_9ACTN|nr:hypothetical protein [Streptosporangium sandarakinum]NYF44662.1 hypothetical protein [Streptosporangium sandarakinum]
MTTTAIAAPDDHGSDNVLIPLPEGVRIPCLADWAIPASIPTTPEHNHLTRLALTCIKIGTDLATGHDGTPRDAELRELHLHNFRAALEAVTADIGPVNLAATAEQAREIADAAHRATTPARAVELDPSVIWELLDRMGHGDHGGWTHDPRWPDVVCGCGETVFRLTIPAPAGR